ncbi:MAG: DNA recombination protein RmuC [Bdellovibrionota bacterium]
MSQMTALEVALGLISFLFIACSGWLARKLFKAHNDLARLEALQFTAEKLQETFKSTAQSALAGNSEQFLQLARTTLEKESALNQKDLEKRKIEIDGTLEPIKNLLTEYQRNLQSLEKDRQRSYTQVETELKRIYEMGNSLTSETSALKNALKRPNVRGRWGEIQLRNCIELAGMSEFADVTFQDEHTGSDDQKLRPDMTVRMPGGRTVIVDAKTPIDAFLSALEELDLDKKAAEFVRHARHIKDHIKDLSKKAYPDHVDNSADFTIMFLPNESFLYAALEVEPDIVEFALQKKVLIATPPTLIGLLKVIRYGWNEAKLAENAQRISETGSELHKRLCDFVDGFVNIGKHLEKAQNEYTAGLTRLKSRVIKKAFELEQLGAKSAKEISITELDAEASEPVALDSKHQQLGPSQLD